MGLCRIIGSLLAGGCILVGSALIWRAIDEQDDDTPGGLDKYVKMGMRYDAFGIFFVGVLTVLYAFLGEKFPKFSGILTLLIIGIIMYTVTQAENHDAAQVNLWRLGIQCSGANEILDAQNRYFAGLVLSYVGFFIAIASLAGIGLGSEYKVPKIIFLIVVTGCAIVSIFLIGTLQSSATDETSPCVFEYKYDALNGVGTTNAIAVGVTFYIWYLAAMSVLSGNRELAGGVVVLVGSYQFFALHFLLDHQADYQNAAFDSDELKSARAGWIFAWFVGFAAVFCAIPVYASEDSIKA